MGQSGTVGTHGTQRQYLLLKDGILYRNVPGKGLNKRLQLVLPKEMATEILRLSGCQETIESKLYWVGDVAEWCKACLVCASL